MGTVMCVRLCRIYLIRVNVEAGILDVIMRYIEIPMTTNRSND